MLDGATCYRALRARDVRFDGIFFVGVRTTGIYCRPICPARTPARERCEFFAGAAQAERAGFRACFRCRPELAPGVASVDAVSRLVRAAVARIEAGYLNEHSIEELASKLGVTSRHLRRAVEAELGLSPVELAQTRRLALAKQLLQDTTLPITEVAFAAGFASVRRFNALFRERFDRPPSALREERGRREEDAIVLRLDYRPPYDFGGMLEFLRGRAIPGVESIESGTYRRTVAIDGKHGWLEVSAEPERSALRARVSFSLAPKLMEVVARLRALFDLDARPDVIEAQLGKDRMLAPLVAARPGLRVPGAFDGFEIAVRTVLGQQVSVRAATTLMARLVERFGGSLPPAPKLAEAGVKKVQKIGIPEARAQTIVALSEAVADQRIELSAGADPEHFLADVQRVRGIGPWTAHYLAMRVLRWPDAYPGTDLVLKRRASEARARAWQPWRSYAVIHIWSSSNNGG